MLLPVLASTVAAALVSIPPSLSFFTDADQTSAVTLTTGGASLNITGGSGAIPSLYPGATMLIHPSSPAVVNNTGDVPLGISIDYAMDDPLPGNLAGNAEFGAALVATAGLCTVGAIERWGAGSLTGVVPSGGSSFLCVAARLPLNAPASAVSSSALSVDIEVTGVQVP